MWLISTFSVLTALHPVNRRIEQLSPSGDVQSRSGWSSHCSREEGTIEKVVSDPLHFPLKRGKLVSRQIICQVIVDAREMYCCFFKAVVGLIKRMGSVTCASNDYYVGLCCSNSSELLPLPYYRTLQQPACHSTSAPRSLLQLELVQAPWLICSTAMCDGPIQAGTSVWHTRLHSPMIRCI